MLYKRVRTVGPVTRDVFHPDKNSHIWLNITTIPLFQPGEEKPYQAYATFEDITERKQAEEAMQMRLNELEKLAEISSTIETAGTLDGMQTMFLDETLKAFNTDTGVNWLSYPSSSTLHYISARGWVENL